MSAPDEQVTPEPRDPSVPRWTDPDGPSDGFEPDVSSSSSPDAAASASASGDTESASADGAPDGTDADAAPRTLVDNFDSAGNYLGSGATDPDPLEQPVIDEPPLSVGNEPYRSPATPSDDPYHSTDQD